MKRFRAQENNNTFWRQRQKEITLRFIQVLDGEIFLVEVPDDPEPARKDMYLTGLYASGFEMKVINKEEADYAQQDLPEGDWEFRLPDKGDTFLTSLGNEGIKAFRGPWGDEKANEFLSGRRWCKKKEEPEITFEELYEAFRIYYIGVPPNAEFDDEAGRALDRAEVRLGKRNAKD